ncbi:hypothetical protein JCM19294_2826 [Nonlabens tegetincola]|uniref:GLPGLI family protein n=1 Tax=Nonlabens tegetincola TaxID=323273 RepID=A0A090PYY0_9FLAO|nr:GLPGLI family protein [Nonlabens tegetincola]GAK96044.1 hypothetical protein JCM19294_2826 [Nonlabens tegetincola]
MKKIFFALIALAATVATAQEISGEATYLSKTKMDTSWMDENRNLTPEQRKRIEQNMKKMSEKTFTLTFNRNESMYKEEKELQTPGRGGRGWGNWMGTSMSGDKYKNLEEKVWLEERDMFGKQFLVTDSLHTIEWEITGEQRQIGQYPAIKAIGTKKNNSLDWSSFRRRQPRNAEEKKKDSIAMKEGRFEDVYEQADEIQVVAWFTPAIPVQHGPAEYGGLPGLILELNAGETTLLCSKVVMNPAEPEEIKKPKKGEVIKEEDYNELFTKKMQEMRQRFRGRGRRG